MTSSGTRQDPNELEPFDLEELGELQELGVDTIGDERDRGAIAVEGMARDASVPHPRASERSDRPPPPISMGHERALLKAGLLDRYYANTLNPPVSVRPYPGAASHTPAVPSVTEPPEVGMDDDFSDLM